MSEDWSDVPAIPVYPNWQSPYTERYEFRTTLFEAKTGDEQRRALRQRPRRSIEYTATPRGEVLREMETMLTLRRDTRLRVPDVTRSIGAEFLSDTFLAVEDFPNWLYVGAEVFVQEGSRSEVCRVFELTETTLQTLDPMVFEYVHPRVSPARKCRLPDAQKVTFPTTVVGTLPMMLAVDPGTEEEYEPETPLQFRGVDTMFIKPNWRDGMSTTFGIPGDRIDYGVGRIAVDYAQELNTSISEYTYLARDRAEVRKHLDLFYRCKGRRGVFYIPTWSSDFEPVGAINYAENEITVRGVYRQQLDAFSFTHRNIALVWGNTVVPCGILSAIPDPLGLRLRLDRNLVSLPIPDRFYASWLVMARFASDELAIDWRTDTIAEISYKVAVVRDSFRELSIGGHRVTFGGDYGLIGGDA